MNRAARLHGRLTHQYEENGARWARVIAALLCLAGVHEPVYYHTNDQVRCWWCARLLQDGKPDWA